MYTPQAGDEGLQLLGVALRDYIVADPTITALLPDGEAGVLPEGFFGPDTPTPALVITRIGHGQSAAGPDVSLVRYIIYALDRGRGYYAVDTLLSRLGTRLNDTETASNFFTFPPSAKLQVMTFHAPGSTATASYPALRAEGCGIYLFTEILGLRAAF